MRRAALVFIRVGKASSTTSSTSSSSLSQSQSTSATFRRFFTSTTTTTSSSSTSTSSSSSSLPPRIPFLPPRIPQTEGGDRSKLLGFVTNVASPTFFATALAATCCVAAAAGQVDADDKRKKRITKTVIGAVFGLDIESETAAKPPEFARDWPLPLRSVASRLRKSWNEASPSERAVAGVAAVNVGVFALWRLPLGAPWHRFLSANFVQRLPPGPPPRPHTLLTANFSHRSGFHLLANTLTLWSIGELAARGNNGGGGGERRSFGGWADKGVSEWKFWAFFGAAGCASSLASHLGRLAVLSLRGSSTARFSFSSLLPLSPTSSRSSTSTSSLFASSSSSSTASGGGGSLGASGSLYTCVTLAALDDPDTRVVVPFFEGIFGSFSIGDALLALLAVDVVGVARGWQRLDHWGHLGGAAAGAVWSRYGDAIWSASLEAARGIRTRAKEAREDVERRRREREKEKRREEAERRRRGG